MAQRYHPLDLCGIDNRHYARNDRNIDICDPALLMESVEDLIIEEELGEQYFRSGIDFFLKALYLCDNTWRFRMALEASQVELDYQKVDALVEAEDWDGAVKILKEVSDFYDTDTKGVEASALMTDCNIIKDAFNDKNAGNYSSAKGKFRQLTKLKDKYAKEPALCEAHEAEKSKQWMTVITTCYGIQIKDYELNYLKNPTGDNDKIISDAFTKDSDDYKAIEAIMKPEGDEEKALVETALKGLKLKQALRLADEMKYDEALALLEELGDFDEAKAKYTSV